MESAEGEWGDFVFKYITKSDYPIVLEHIRNVYCVYEPMLKHCGYTDEVGRDFTSMGKYTLESNTLDLSFYAMDKKTGLVVGVLIADHVEKSDLIPFPFPFESLQVARLEFQLVKIVQDARIFERFPKIDAYGEFLFISVHPQYQNRGLASEIFRRGIQLFKQHGLKLCLSEFTSPITRKIGDKFGFEEMVRLKFADFKDKDGNFILNHANPDDFMCIKFLPL